MYKKSSVLIHSLLFALSAVALCSCNRLKNTEHRIDDLTSLAAQSGFQKQRINTAQFELLTFYHDLDNADTVDVFIEGDGFAWRRKNRLSKDPTPLDSIPFKLAIQSKQPAIYLARPCQYQAKEKIQQCHPRYWSSHRYATEVLESLNSALNHYQQKFEIQRFRLIGYSGGGALAVLLAAKRNDVMALLTIAANLDHEYWTEYHQVSPLTGSLNAVDVVEDIVKLPQLHVLGSKDKVIPEDLIDRYIERSNDSENIKKMIVKGYDHHCCWKDKWPEIQREFNRLTER